MSRWEIYGVTATPKVKITCVEAIATAASQQCKARFPRNSAKSAAADKVHGS
jgi:hypothetical protein